MAHDASKKSFLTRVIEELQALEDPMKQKVLVVTTVLVMAVVVYLWFGYFGTLITAIPQEQPPIAANAPSNVAAGTQNGPDIWQNMKNGAAYVYGIFHGPKQYDVTPSQ